MGYGPIITSYGAPDNVRKLYTQVIYCLVKLPKKLLTDLIDIRPCMARSSTVSTDVPSRDNAQVFP